MGDTYFIKKIKCVYCGEINDFKEEAVAFGSSGLPYTFEDGGEFICENCKKKNKIKMEFVSVKSKSSKKQIK